MAKDKKLKILFLCMSCREQLFVEQNETVKQTWGKAILDREYGDNVDLLFYDGWNETHAYDAEHNMLHVRCEDDGPNTFKKTYYALKLIQRKWDYDYVFRTNTSTYINVPLAIKLIEWIDEHNDDESIWGCDLMSVVEAATPFPLDVYCRGNGYILSRKVIDVIMMEGIPHLYREDCDDVTIGNLWNSYWIKQHKDYLDHVKSYGHGWFRCVESFDGSSNHQLCEYYNDNADYDFLKQFITIQIKQYYHRSDEHENYMLLHKSFEGRKDDDIDTTLEHLIEYSKNPDIFIGSIIGYIDMNRYKGCNKNELWNVQCANKADNDPWKEVYKDKIWF